MGVTAKIKDSEDAPMFEFEEINLIDVRKILPTKANKYADIVNQVVIRINEMPEGKTFTIAAKKKPDEKENPHWIANFKGAINKTLLAEGLAWRAVYSKEYDLFVIAPLKQKGKKAVVRGSYEKRDLLPVDKKRTQPLLNAAIKMLHVSEDDLRTSQRNVHTARGAEIVQAKMAVAIAGVAIGLKHREIAPLLGFAHPGAVAAMCYQAKIRKGVGEKALLITKALSNGGHAK